MYDFVRISLLSSQYAEYLRNNEYLSFVKESKGEYSSATTYIYNGLTFIVYNSGRIIINGSLHKYWNRGEHNHNDFSYSDLLVVIEDLVSKFTPCILTGQINNIEVGLNINPPFASTDYLNKVITLIGAEKHPITNEDRKGFKKGFHFQKSHYGIKIYDKGKQYNRAEQIIRHEFKTYKMQALQDVGIKRLYDLCDVLKTKHALEYLFREYKNILIKEVVNIEELSKHKERIYLECVNPDSWNNWRRDKRYTRKSQYEEIISEFGQSDIKCIIYDLMRLKAQELLTETKKSTDVFTRIQPYITQAQNNESADVFTINIIGKNVVSVRVKRTCLSCGKDISHQSEKSKYCSAKYVGYEQAHKCRNAGSNPRNNFTRKVELIKSKGVLFDIMPFLKPTG